MKRDSRKIWAEKNKEKIDLSRKKWAENNQDKIKAYRDAHEEELKDYQTKMANYYQ